jgi:hypothetical protein
VILNAHDTVIAHASIAMTGIDRSAAPPRNRGSLADELA